MAQTPRKRAGRASSPDGTAEHRRAEEELDFSAAETLRQTLASIGDGVIVTDSRGRVIFINGEAERLTGWTSRAAQGHPLKSVFPIINEFTRRPVEDPVKKVLRLGKVVGLANHTMLLAKDGREIPIDDSGAPILKKSDGTMRGVVLVFRDFTEQKQAERVRARLAAIVESSDDAILSKDLNGVIQTWNAGATRLFGYRAEEVIGQPITLLLPSERIQEEEQILERIRAGQSVEHLETVRTTRDGRRLDVSVTVSPVKDENGHVIGASKILRDITQRKIIEQELKELTGRLEARVRERTAELERRTAQLRALAAELAQTEERERNRLAQVLHDHLQQLLVAARYGVIALQNKANADVQIEVQHVLDLLGQSIDAGRSLTMELSPPVLRVGGLPAGLTWLSQWMQEKHGIAIEVSAQDPPIALSEDLRLMCFQAVRELLLNVANHAGVTSARVTMTHDRDRELRIAVSDQGKGFDPIAHAAGDFHGTFGLFSIRERFELIGGRLEIDSAPDRGTRAILTVPIPPAVPSQTKESTPSVNKPTIPMPAPGLIRILIADDHTVVRKGLIEILLREPGITVVGEAADGQHAIDQARQLKPDVVLMDITMPRMNGIDATRVLSREMPEVRVIGLSMHTNLDMAAQMQEAGAVRYLAKDGPIEDLVAAIRES